MSTPSPTTSNPGMSGLQTEALIRALSEIASAGSVTQVGDLLCDAAAAMTGGEKASLALIVTGKLEFISTTLTNGERARHMKVKLGTGIPGKVALDGLPRRVTQGEYQSPVSGVGMPPQGSHQPDSLICVPLLKDDRPMGTLQVFNCQGGREFGPSDECCLRMLAQMGAVLVERTRLQDQLLLEGKRINGIFQALTDGIMVVDDAGTPILYNKAVEELFFPNGSQNYALTTYLISAPTAGQDVGTSEVVLFKPHGHVLSNRFVTLRDPDGKRGETIISIRNISEQRRSERRYAQFFAIMLHRSARLLRTAVRVGDPKRKKRLLSTLREVHRHVLAFTELRSGPLRIERENCDFLGLYRQARKPLAEAFRRKGIHLKDESLLASPPFGGRFDPAQMRQVLAAVLRSGRRCLGRSDSLELTLAPGDPGLKLVAAFSGPGISSRICSECLDWNVQIEAIIAGEKKSLDLDLAFARHVLRAHRGSIEVDTPASDQAIIRIALPRE